MEWCYFLLQLPYIIIMIVCALFVLIITIGNTCMITGGHNIGRVGSIVHRERHPGSFDIVHVKDAVGHTFATR